MGERIRKVFIISNRLKLALENDFHKHYVVQSNQGLLYPLTHNDESYKGIKNIKISDEDILGLKKEQFMVPLGHEHNPTEMLLKPTVLGDKYFVKYKTELQQGINLSNNITLRKITEYFNGK